MLVSLIGLFYASRWRGSTDKANLAMGVIGRVACREAFGLHSPGGAWLLPVAVSLGGSAMRPGHRRAAAPPFVGQSPSPTSSGWPWWQRHAPLAPLGGFAAIRRAEPSSHSPLLPLPTRRPTGRRRWRGAAGRGRAGCASGR